MTNTQLSPAFESLLASSSLPGPTLYELTALAGQTLQADRCFFYLRNPATALGKIAFCWCKDASIPDVTEPAWKTDLFIAIEDPLFAAALRTDPSVFVADVETAPPTVLNRDFEARTFGHRSLIHAHLTEKGQLWGILQPCLFGQPRIWSTADRAFIEALLPRLLPLVKAYVKELNI